MIAVCVSLVLVLDIQPLKIAFPLEVACILEPVPLGAFAVQCELWTMEY